jgi:phage anti-repressor protein
MKWENILLAFLDVGTRWRSWLRHRATSRKVAVSIPVGVIEIFH